jgi:fermentation-respiration switch protein FrsA (DUF1100 family)
MTRMAITFVVAACVAYVALVAAAGYWQRRLIYLPSGSVPAPAAAGLETAETVAFTTDDGLTLRGWFMPAGASPARATVVVFNGNGGNRALRAPLAAGLSRRGLATLLFDYRGYGDSEGTPSEDGLARDARAARAYVASRPDVASNRLVYFGESLGTSVAVRLATEEPPAALILRSPFTSLADVGAHHYPILPVRWLLRDRYASIDRIAQIRCPLLVIAGDQDAIVPIAFSQRLFDAAPEPKQMIRIDGANHNDLELLAGPRLIEAVDRFLAGRTG